MRRAPAALVVACLALAAAGCGGTSSSTGSASSAAASGASAAPASAPAFVSLNSDLDSKGWSSVDELLGKFPAKTRLLTMLRDSLRKNSGLDFETDVKPALGPEVDLVFLDGQGTDVVGLTQPKDDAKFQAMLDKGNKADSSSQLLSEKVGDWTVLADSQAKLSRYKTSAAGAKLADDADFKAAMDGLPGEAVATVYVNGSSVTQALMRQIPRLATSSLKTQSFRWLGAAVESTSDGLKFEGNTKTTSGKGGANFKSKLVGDIPAGVLGVVSFRSSGGLGQLKQVEQNPTLKQGLGQFTQALGVSLEDIARLASGEGAIYARQGSPFPEFTIVLEEKDPAQAVATLDRIAARARTSFHTPATKPSTISGVTVQELSLGQFSIFYAGFGSELVVTTSRAAISDLRASGDKLADDADFKTAKDAAGLPDDNAGFVYLNLKDAIEVAKSYAQVAGQSIPATADANLRPLQSFLSYASVDGDSQHFAGFLRIQ